MVARRPEAGARVEGAGWMLKISDVRASVVAAPSSV
jgi:hypothetical protein